MTSAAHRLRVSRFGGEATRAINRTAAKGHGRTVTCLDRGEEPIAALAYHREDHAPLLVTAIAVLRPEAADAATVALSRAMAAILLCYLAAAAEVAGLPHRIGFAPSDAALASELGFRPAAPPSPFAASAGRYLEWQPPRELPLLMPSRGLLGR